MNNHGSGYDGGAKNSQNTLAQKTIFVQKVQTLIIISKNRLARFASLF